MHAEPENLESHFLYTLTRINYALKFPDFRKEYTHNSKPSDISSGEKSMSEIAQSDREPTTESEIVPDSEVYILRLYVAGQTKKSLAAFANLRKICEEYLGGRYTIEVIDLLENPHLAKGDQILAVPTLVRRLPPPIKKIIGDLSNTERVLVGLDLRPAI